MQIVTKDMTGLQIGNWSVLQRGVKVKKGGGYYYLCRCICGVTREVAQDNLKRGQSTSCGKHPKSPDPEILRQLGVAPAIRTVAFSRQEKYTYKSWQAMCYRCNNPKYSDYNLYGGRGITVCPEWSDFRTFLNDMGRRPDKTTLDRIDTSGNYTKENCRWADHSTQMKNRRKYNYVRTCGPSNRLRYIILDDVQETTAVNLLTLEEVTHALKDSPELLNKVYEFVPYRRKNRHTNK